MGDTEKEAPGHARPGENAHIAEDVHEGSMALASEFRVEGIRFTTRGSAATHAAAKKHMLYLS